MKRYGAFPEPTGGYTAGSTQKVYHTMA